ncbi:MAG: NAD(P)H-dependent oxidoreductase subunit E [Desulfobacterales bacterium]|nr:NAD(P)H-dependent oxidoreductase subunit E [Desulfobacterales bacterium]
MSLAMRPEHADITPDMWPQIDEVIAVNRSIKGSVIAVLRQCQDVVGYLPVELMEYIASGMNLARSDVFGVASFYALFSFEPKGRHTLKVCTGTACYVKGIKEIITRICNEYDMEEGGTSPDMRFTLEPVRCLGACGLAPVMVIGADTHGDVSSDKVVDILQAYE